MLAGAEYWEYRCPNWITLNSIVRPSCPRFQIHGGDQFPNLALSPQAVINCRAGGSCEGGNPAGVYEFAASVGVPDVTCLVYEAVDGGEL